MSHICQERSLLRKQCDNQKCKNEFGYLGVEPLYCSETCEIEDTGKKSKSAGTRYIARKLDFDNDKIREALRVVYGW